MMIIMAKNKLRNGFQPNNQQRPNVPGNNPQPQATVETPVEETEVTTLEDVAADVEMMSQEDANSYYLTYQDMEAAHAEMSRCGVPTLYISKIMADVLDFMEIEETEGGLIRTQEDVYAEITKMDEVAKLSNEMFGLNINLATDDTEAAKHYRALFNFKEDAPENKTEAGRVVSIPKKNEEALDLIFQEWAALSLTGYNAIYTNEKGENSWTYAGIYDNVDAMYPAEA
jgi:hypothetical protein